MQEPGRNCQASRKMLLRSNAMWCRPHQELGRLDEPAGETFRELASCLASELESEEQERQRDKN